VVVQASPERTVSYTSQPLGTWADDTRAAFAASPNYFMAWYTAKSLALVAAVGVAAYYIGKGKRMS
jgi:hypothetical protein